MRIRCGECFYLRLRAVLREEQDNRPFAAPAVGGVAIDKSGKQIGETVYWVPEAEAVPIRLIEKEIKEGDVEPL